MMDISDVISIGEDFTIMWEVGGPAKTEGEAFEYALSLKEYIEELLKKNPNKKHKLLINISPKVDSVFTTIKHRRVYFDIFSSSQLGKIAVIVNDTYIRMVVEYFTKQLGREGETQCFSDKDSALIWLKKV